MSAVIDTNVLIFDTFEDSDLHEEAEKLLDSLKEWMIPSIVFHEYIWFMKAENINSTFSQKKMIEYLTHVKSRFLPTEVDDILFSVQNMKEYRNYNDFLILSAAKRTGHPLLTFDEKLKRHASRHGVKTL